VPPLLRARSLPHFLTTNHQSRLSRMVALAILRGLTSFVFAITICADAIQAITAPWANSKAVIRPRQNSTSTNSTAAQQLANGIGFNIMAQQGEIAVVQAMMQLNQAGTSDPAFFKAANVRQNQPPPLFSRSRHTKLTFV
jgi:hypothetical protein